MKALVILGCEGYQQNGFHFCHKVENVILDLEKIERTENYFDLIKYLDNVVKLFEQPCGKQHFVSNAIYKFYEMSYIGEQTHQYIAHFYEMHKRCNLILSCVVKEDNDE